MQWLAGAARAAAGRPSALVTSMPFADEGLFSMFELVPSGRDEVLIYESHRPAEVVPRSILDDPYALVKPEPSNAVSHTVLVRDLLEFIERHRT
jgi:hypothetical protein